MLLFLMHNQNSSLLCQSASYLTYRKHLVWAREKSTIHLSQNFPMFWVTCRCTLVAPPETKSDTAIGHCWTEVVTESVTLISFTTCIACSRLWLINQDFCTRNFMLLMRRCITYFLKRDCCDHSLLFPEPMLFIKEHIPARLFKWTTCNILDFIEYLRVFFHPLNNSNFMSY